MRKLCTRIYENYMNGGGKEISYGRVSTTGRTLVLVKMSLHRYALRFTFSLSGKANTSFLFTHVSNLLVFSNPSNTSHYLLSY